MQIVLPPGSPKATSAVVRSSQPVRSAVLFDVAARASELLEGVELRELGHCARTLFVEGALRLVLIGLRTGVRIPPHHTNLPTTVHTITGHARLHCDGPPLELLPGTVLIFEPSNRK